MSTQGVEDPRADQVVDQFEMLGLGTGDDRYRYRPGAWETSGPRFVQIRTTLSDSSDPF